ncbi:aminotransferase class V-fold PLP-dependent enzyme [Pedobacter jamesrossensis]|uniref:Aminotransferase class V-fold PLP-dependent enzyme n=1 Tax=Pedobacter jamesrossensis TaxID=1908238 RepID=A0ABV8NNM5_9SPHI
MNFLQNFPILENYIYLNTANSGLLSKDISVWRNEHDSDFIENGSIFRMNNLDVMERLRINLSNIFSVGKDNIFLSPNFSTGFNTILNGLDNNHRFLLLEEDYPSVSYPVTSRGFDFFEVPIDANLEENILNAIEKFKPSVFAFSMVQYISGIRMQSDFIIKLKSNFPDLLLIADGTQFTGTTIFNFETSGLDALIGSGYKWLLGGYGNGYLFLSEQIKNLLYPNGKNAKLPTAPFLSGKNYLSLCLEPGHLDSLTFGSLNQSLDYLKNIGFNFIEEKCAELSNKARIELYSRGLIPEWMLARKEQSTIISIPLKNEIVKKLENVKILCSARGKGIRISFHFYNTENDLNRFLEALY